MVLAFSLLTIGKIRCPWDRCQNMKLFDMLKVTKHLCWNGLTLDYKTGVFPDEKCTVVAAKQEVNDQVGTNRIDEMLEAIQPEFNLDTENQPMTEVEDFSRLLNSLEEMLHEHTKVTLFTFVTQLMATKSEFFFSNNCYKEPLKFIGDILPKPNELPKYMYHTNKLVKGLDMDY
jgi:hypothetical protein